jgi:hypothetical protein
MTPMSKELSDLSAAASAELATAAVPPPVGTPIMLERFPDGLTIQVPPAGLFRGSHGLFLFGLIWLVVVTFICAVLFAALIDGNMQEKNVAFILPAVMSIFWLAGLGLLLTGINMGRRKAAIAVTGGTLMVIQTGLFGSKKRDWEPGDVEGVRVGPSGMEVNDKPVLELQIYDGGAHKFGLLSGRTNEELYWIAAELRAVLGVGERPS